MNKLLTLLAFIVIILLTSCSSNEEATNVECWEFHHSIMYRSPNSEWESYKDTICNISEIEAENYRALHNVSDDKWIRRCTKRKITESHPHVK